MSMLNWDRVIKFNKLWEAFEVLTIGEAITFLCPQEGKGTPGFAVDYELTVDEDGNKTIVYSTPVTWDDWIKLPVRENDMRIGTSRGDIRVPLIVICANYKRVPMVTRTETIWERDEGVCQYTRRKLTREEGNLDHVIPRDRGGSDSPENLVVCDRDINSMKGNRLNEEINLKLIRQPRALKARTMRKVLRKQDARHPDQVPFLID